MSNNLNSNKMNILHRKLYESATFLEVIVGIVALIPIVFSLLFLLEQMALMNFREEKALTQFMYIAFEIIIAVEFAKLIFVHTIDTTVEIIIMAIVRQIIVEHTSPVDTFILVTSVAVLCVVRKYLFIRELDKITADKKD